MKKWFLAVIIILNVSIQSVYNNSEKIARLKESANEHVPLSLQIPPESHTNEEDYEVSTFSNFLLKIIACSNALSAEECDIDTQYECAIQ